MAPIKNTSIIYNMPPHGTPVLNETLLTSSALIDLESVELNGGLLVRPLYFSLDPFQRVFMVGPSSPFYSMFFQLGKSIWGYAVVSVVRSERSGIEPGAKLYVKDCPFQEYSVLSAEHPVRLIDPTLDVPLAAYIGILGMPGQTAFYGLEVVGKPVKGETIYVSSAAGPVGASVVQLSKSKGLKVIASAGSEDKVAFLKTIGVDVAFNYKTTDMAGVLAKEGAINIYWDNVGGPTLEAALEYLAFGGRVVVCGAVSNYSSKEPYGIKTAHNIMIKRLSIQGFHANVGEEEYEGQQNNPVKFLETLIPMVETGQIKWKEQVFNGIESVGEAMVALHSGANTGKVVIKLASD